MERFLDDLYAGGHDWIPTSTWNTSKGPRDLSPDGYLYRRVWRCRRCSSVARDAEALLVRAILPLQNPQSLVSLVAGPLGPDSWSGDSCDDVLFARHAREVLES